MRKSIVFRHCRCASFIKGLRIKKGDAIKIHSVGKRIIELLNKSNQKLLARLHKYRWRLPVNFDRLEASKNQNAGSQSMTEEQFDEILNSYAAGNISRRDVEGVTGLWFGDILAELGRRGLQLPLFDTRVLLNEKQLALYNTIFSKQLPEHEV